MHAASIETDKSFSMLQPTIPTVELRSSGLGACGSLPCLFSLWMCGYSVRDRIAKSLNIPTVLTMLLPWLVSCCPAAYPDPPSNCSAVPATALSDGSWPSSCAGMAIGAKCSANCTYGGGANVTCMTDGEWDTTTVGTCAGACRVFGKGSRNCCCRNCYCYM